MESVPILQNAVETQAEALRQNAADRFSAALSGMKIEHLVPWEEIGIDAPQELTGEAFRDMQREERRVIVDAIANLGMQDVYTKHSPEERKSAHTAIDQEMRDAKWGYLLALHNEAFDLGYDSTDLEILNPLCSQLATVERGSSNPLMASTHKLRHNPMSHSLHIISLVDDVTRSCDELHGEIPQKHQEDWQALKKQLFRAAVVHDMGELNGEFSVAADRSEMTAEEIAHFERHRGDGEHAVFENALEHRFAYLAKQGLPHEDLQMKITAFEQDFEQAEASDQFFGLAFKCIERMQSNEDYMRFSGQGFNEHSKATKAVDGLSKRLELVDPAEREFLYAYVQDPFDGTHTSIGERFGKMTLQSEKAKPSLRELAGDDALSLILTDGVETEMLRHNKELMNSMQQASELDSVRCQPGSHAAREKARQEAASDLSLAR